jgi:hypothetical protein
MTVAAALSAMAAAREQLFVARWRQQRGLGMAPAKRRTRFGSGLGVSKVARPSSPSPEEGRRLVVAFMGIKDSEVREALIRLLERMSRAYE